jgi:hypothetical protein
MGIFDFVAAGVALLFGFLFFKSARGAAPLIRRIKRTETSRAAELKPGVVELKGRFDAMGELKNLNGQEVVVLRRTIRYLFHDGKRTTSTTLPTKLTQLEIEIVDESGSAVLDLDGFLLYAPRAEFNLPLDEVKKHYPELLEGVPTNAVGLIVEEQYVPKGAAGFISGWLSEEPPRATTNPYREKVPRVRITGDANRPLIVSAWPEETIVRMLQIPVRNLYVMATLAWLIAAALMIIPRLVFKAAGL